MRHSIALFGGSSSRRRELSLWFHTLGAKPPTLCVVAVALAFPAGLLAQVPVRGTILDEETQEPIAYAVVTLLDASGTEHDVATSGDDGQFEFVAGQGRYSLLIRQIGAKPFQTGVFEADALEGAVLLTILVPRQQVTLDTLTVTGDAPVFAPGPLAGFEARRQRGLGGIFLTYETIRMKNPVNAVDAFYGLAGVMVLRWGSIFAVRMRGRSPLSSAGQARNSSRFGGGGTTPPVCPPTLYVDGIRVRNVDATLSELPVADLYAVEVYRRASETPGEFVDSDSYCGVILVWTKRFQPDEPEP